MAVGYRGNLAHRAAVETFFSQKATVETNCLLFGPYGYRGNVARSFHGNHVVVLVSTLTISGYRGNLWPRSTVETMVTVETLAWEGWRGNLFVRFHGNLFNEEIRFWMTCDQ